MAMLTVYADESGTDGSSPMVADGGYVCMVEWDDFQVEWDRFCGPRRESRVSYYTLPYRAILRNMRGGAATELIKFLHALTRLSNLTCCLGRFLYR